MFSVHVKEKGSRPRKGTKNRGCPLTSQVPTPTVHEMKQRNDAAGDESLKFKKPLSLEHFQNFISLTSLICTHCNNMVDKPVETKCGHIACATCLTELVDCSGLLKCPGCSLQLCRLKDVKQASPVVMGILRQLQVHCELSSHY